MNLMLQKEVVQRICAKIGDKNYGRLAIMLNLLCDTKMLFEVNKMVFSPPPKITSAIVQIIPNGEKIEKYFEKNNLKKFEKVVQQAFNQRRKMLKSSLKGSFINQDLAEIFEKCNIAGTKRAEELTIEEFWKMSQILK